MIVCQRTGKDSYESKAAVKRRSRIARSDAEVFKCKHCNGWHFGGQKSIDTRIKVHGVLIRENA